MKRWLKKFQSWQSQRKLRSLAHWERERAKGKGRFVWRAGMTYIGVVSWATMERTYETALREARIPERYAGSQKYFWYRKQSSWFEHDYHHFKPLVDHTAKQGFQMKEISADKGYLGADNLMTTLRHGAIPYIPFKTNSVAQSGYDPKSTLWTRMYHFYSLNRAEFLQHYHKRSNVETTFHMIKSKFGQRLRSRTLTAQINEALCKVLCHNLCVVIQSVHELGIEANFEAALSN
jgi:hypothetical protein